MAIQLSHPLKGNPAISGHFGPRQSFQLPNGLWTLPFHYGTDWAVPEGTPIYASHDGTARTVGWDYSTYGGGYWVQIVNGNYSTWYLHMREQSPIAEGSHVKRGQLIGYVGSTGASTGPHLHLELHVNGAAVNPVPYITQQDTSPDHPPFISSPLEDGEIEMSKNIGHYIGGNASTPARERTCVIYNPVSGFYTTWSGVDQEYTNDMARAFNTGSFNFITQKHWDQTIRPRLDEIRRGR